MRYVKNDYLNVNGVINLSDGLFCCFHIPRENEPSHDWTIDTQRVFPEIFSQEPLFWHSLETEFDPPPAVSLWYPAGIAARFKL